jgi:hypothetical protein
MIEGFLLFDLGGNNHLFTIVSFHGGIFLLAMKRTKAMWMVNLLSLTIVMSIGCLLLWLMIVFKN